MRLSIRVGETVADLQHFNRLKIDSIYGRLFLTGVRNSGRVFALFGIRVGLRDSVMDAIQSAIATNKPVCLLTNELFEIDSDADSLLALDMHNRGVNSATERIERPTTAAENILDVHS